MTGDGTDDASTDGLVGDGPEAAGQERPSGSSGEADRIEYDPVLFAGVLEDLTQRVEDHSELLEQLAQVLTDEPGGGPWCWRELAPQAQVALLGELREWVDWLITRYSIGALARSGTIAPCWYHHPVAVEELTALMVAWRAAFNPQQLQPSDAPAAWHDRWLWPTLRRLEDLKVFSGCRQGQHEAATSRPRPLTDAADFASYVDTLARGDDGGGNGDKPGRKQDAGVDEDTGGSAMSDDEMVELAELSVAAMNELVAAGRAERLFFDDPVGPVRVAGHWWGIEHGRDDVYVLLDADRAAALVGIASRLQLAGASASDEGQR